MEEPAVILTLDCSCVPHKVKNPNLQEKPVKHTLNTNHKGNNYKPDAQYR